MVQKKNGGGRSNKATRGERLTKDSQIAIIGCGIAGLSTAICLVKAGFTNVSILERDASHSSRREGFGMTLTYNPKGPMSNAHLGILESVAQQDCPSRSHYVFSPDGTVLGYYGNAFYSNSTRGVGQRGNLRVPRQKLREILIDRFQELVKQNSTNKVQQSKIYWNQSVLDISECEEQGGKNVKVELKLRCNTNNHGKSNNDADTTSTNTIEQAEGIYYSKTFDLLIAADGVNSCVVSKLAPPHCCAKPRPLNIGIVLGIAENVNHALLDERGFYTINGVDRLFIMPYEGDRYATTRRRVMWQLSYRCSDEEEDDSTSPNGTMHRNPEFLRDKVLNICSSWHQPVTAMIQATPLETIWGTHLVDRDPQGLQEAFRDYRRVVVLGDALHGMSPFKGQGANQALQDGPLVADWLQKAQPDAAVRGIWREAVQRTEKVVKASRQAANFWHSPKCLEVEEGTEQMSCFAGVRNDCCALLLVELRQRGITADLAENLDSAIRNVIEELQISEPQTIVDENHYQHLYSDILDCSSLGETERLRQLSLVHAPAVRLARNEEKQSALHLAVLNSHYQTCNWLLTEAFMDPLADFDSKGKVPMDYATEPSVVTLLQKVSSYKNKSKQRAADNSQ